MTRSRDSFVVRLARQTLFLLVSLALICGSAAAAAPVKERSSTSVGPVSSFAISDLDGDLHPDLVNVHTGRIGGFVTEYWVQLHLTSSSRQSIRLVAPSGGLLIAARDVNGDHAVDLVVATAWLKRPVAVLLNDGHGSFSQVELTAFPGAFAYSTEKCVSDSDQTNEAVGTPLQSTFGFCLEAKSVSALAPHADAVSLSSLSFLADSSLIFHAGRAPPLS